MTQWLTLSRAAHLLGISRVACKSASATGSCRLSMAWSMPTNCCVPGRSSTWPSLAASRKTRAIREDAFAKRLRERVLPSQEALAQRLFAQGQELAELQRTLTRYHR
jgi:CDP-4-dehydro-6-deoxyglucose reductase